MTRTHALLLSVVLLPACAGDAAAPCPDPDEAASTGGEAAIVVMDQGTERAFVPIAGRPAHGPSDALVTIVEITDFECPFCSRVQPAIARLLETYPDARLVVRNNPLPMHPDAELAAEAALEAYAQGGDAAFFRFHDLLFQNQHALAPTDLVRYAASIGLDVPRFEAALADHRHEEAIREDVSLAASLGATGTPAFFINGRLLLGAQPYERFEELFLEERAAAEALVAQGLAPARVYDAVLAAARAQLALAEADYEEAL
jgi:protein-disulfide isomerase